MLRQVYSCAMNNTAGIILGGRVKKLIFSGLVLLMGLQAQAKSHKIDLGDIKYFDIMVSCSSEYNSGEISSKSIIESFNIVGSNEEYRDSKSGCQSNQSYPLFVKDNELHMWVKFIDGSTNDEERYAEMQKQGSISLGRIDNLELPACNGPGTHWFNKIRVEALPGLKIFENIIKTKKNGRKYHSHNMTISDGEKSINTVGWITKRAKASKSEERFCYFNN